MSDGHQKGTTRLFRRKRARLVAVSAGLVIALWISGVRLYAFPGASMSPTVRPGDHFVGMVGLWGKRSPQRFDMVIFQVPADSPAAAFGVPWMKRLVGMPGERVLLSRGDLFINGQKIEAPFLHAGNSSADRTDFEIKLGDSEYCVLGDNLDQSLQDSRSLGPIPRSLIKGRALFVIRTRR